MFSKIHNLYDDTLPRLPIHVPSVGPHDLFCKFTQKIRGFNPRAIDNLLNKS